MTDQTDQTDQTNQIVQKPKYNLRTLLDDDGCYEVTTAGGIMMPVTLKMLKMLTATPKETREPTKAELLMFANLVLEHHLNPYTKECWLVPLGKGQHVKYEPIVSAQAKLRMARSCKDYRGFRQGWITQDGTRHKAGIDSTALPADIIGIWGQFLRDGQEPLYQETFLHEYKKSENPYSSWGKLPLTMLQKVNRDHGHRLLYPEMFDGLYTENEIAQAPDAAYECRTPKRGDRKPAEDVAVSDTVPEAGQSEPDANLLVHTMVDGLIAKFRQTLADQFHIDLPEMELPHSFMKFCCGMCGGLPEDYAKPATFTTEICQAINKGLDNNELVGNFVSNLYDQICGEDTLPDEPDVSKLDDQPIEFICAECKTELAEDNGHGICPECGANSVGPCERKEAMDGRDNTTGR